MGKHDYRPGTPAVVRPQDEGEKLNLSLPLGEVDEDAFIGARHVQVHLTHKQAVAMRRLRNGLDAAGARMANRKPVQTAADVVRFVLDRIG